MPRYKVDFVAPSEKCFTDKGQLTETGVGYTFFWSGRSSKERREPVWDFAIKTTRVQKLKSISEVLNDHLIKMQLPLRHTTNSTLISAYAPTMTNPEETKGRFYEELDALISSTVRPPKPVTSDQRSQAGLCPGFNAVQHDAFSQALVSSTGPTKGCSTPGGCKPSRS